MGQEGVSYYATEHPYILRTLMMKIMERRGELLNQLQLAQDWGDFRHRSGMLDGLQAVVHLIEDMDKERK